MNEPEWVIKGLKQGTVHSKATPLTQKQFFTFADRVSDAVHKHTKHYVTIGMEFKIPDILTSEIIVLLRIGLSEVV